MAAVGGLGEVNSVSDLERKLAEIHIPQDEIAPAHIHEWLNVYSRSHSTSSELLFAGTLPCSSAFIGNTKVNLFDSFREKGNLFMLGLAPFGAGKTPACNIGCVKPLISHLEPRIDRSILVDETSSNGLFNHFVNFQKGADGECVPVLCIEQTDCNVEVNIAYLSDNGTYVQALRRRLLVSRSRQQRKAGGRSECAYKYGDLYNTLRAFD